MKKKLWVLYSLNRMPEKTIFYMKMTIVFILLCCLHVSATTYSQELKLNLNLNNVSLHKAFEAIEKKTAYRFVYNANAIPDNIRVNLQTKDMPLSKVLEKLINSNALIYRIINDKVIAVTSLQQMMRVVPIRGIVTDSLGAPLQGVSIVVKGSRQGTLTDEKGAFEIDAPDDATIEVSRVGYVTREIRITGESTINIVLKEATTDLNEVIIIGYGTKLKEGDLTGSVVRLSGDKLKSRPVAGTMDALQGLIPGVSVTRNSGKPGGQGYQMSIRGVSSINGNVPLVLIDGIPGDLNLINPEDIEDITVLKDATAAIYGARAGDGVILVTTKRGKASDKPNISYSFNMAFKDPAILKKPATTEHLVKMFNEANKNDGDPQTFSDETLAKIAANDPGFGPGENWSLQSYPMFYQSRDWYGSLFKTSSRPTHNVSVSGGSKTATYMVSFGDSRDNGNIVSGKNSSVRDNLRADLQVNLLQNLKLNVNTSYDDLTVKEPSMLNDGINIGLKIFSYVPLRNPAGNYYAYQGYGNNIQELEMGGLRTVRNARWRNNVKLDWEPVKGLVWTGQLGINQERYDEKSNLATVEEFNWDNSVNSLIRNKPNSARYYNWNSMYKNLSTYVNYDKIINKHEIKLMLGTSGEKFTRESRYMQGADFTSNEIFTLPLSDPKNLSAGDYWDNNPWALLSYFGRGSYSFDGKYYIQGTLRKDGSSKFSSDKRWSDIYPSISAAWKISEEKFFKNLINRDIVNMLKARVSWGKTGNQDIPSLGLFDYIQLIRIAGQYPIDGTSISKMASLNGIASPERTWETIETKNLGIDLSMFKSKLFLSFDIYRKDNKNMLVSVTYPATLGAAAPSLNAGRLLDKGWEINASWNSMIGNVKFNLGTILNYNTNVITDLQGQDAYNVGLTSARQGYPLYSYFGYKGSVIRTQAELDAYAAKYAGKGIVPALRPNGYGGLGIGDVMYEDLDGDGQITAYGDKSKGFNGDAVFLGSQIPKFTYSITGGLNYKNFDLSFILQGTGNKYVWRGNGNFGVPFSYSWFQPLDYFYGRTFNEDNTSAQYPRLSNNGTVKGNNYQFSSLWLENTRYLRMKNLSIGYTFKTIQLSKLKLRDFRIYVSGQDIFEWAKGTWDHMYDPEESNPDPNNYTFYENNYPMYRTFSFGATINF
ncbi:SusC/RagA family TonB-linked outer membrane protein [Niabella aquatica]